MLSNSPIDSPQLSFFDITQQLNQSHPLLALFRAIPWAGLENEFTGLLMLKPPYDLSDESLVEQR